MALAYETTLGRSPTDDELKRSLDFITEQIKAYETDESEKEKSEKGKTELLAITDFAQALFASNEFIYSP